MKKILFRKLLWDCSKFFLISLISASVIIWIFQAVNFLDIIVEDGRDFKVYLTYTILQLPKIISKILPFALFFSIFYIINDYEKNNELIIFWNFGVPKIDLVNFFFKISLIFTLIQITLTVVFVPLSQNISRNLIKDSNIGFFESLIKPKKFNDNVRGLTIYADDKDKNGKLKNIYLKKDNDDRNYQITVAKTGEFVSSNNSKILKLYNGQTVNLLNNKMTTFNFSKSDFILNSLDSDIIIQEKVQETSTLKHFKCIDKYFNKNLTLKKEPGQFVNANCSLSNLNNIFQELYKRLILPLYLPTLILIGLLTVIKSKESIFFQRYKIMVFLIGIIVIIISESSVKFIVDNIFDNLKLSIIPIILIFCIYIYYRYKFDFKIKKI